MIEKIQKLLADYADKGISEVVDYEKFSGYSIVHHSSGIEGSTLTEIDTQLLLEEGITPAGKPLEHSLMVKDHYAALQFVINEFPESITTEYIQTVNAKVMASTGVMYNTPLGTVDAANGEFRKGNVTVSGSYFPNFDKVERLVNELVQWINEAKPGTLKEKLELSFDAHFNLVSIHPFYDGNGRTSRLLMNGMQHKWGLPMGVVYLEDKQAYYEAIIKSRELQSKEPFREFMFSQYAKLLSQTLEAYNKGINQTTDFFFLKQ